MNIDTLCLVRAIIVSLSYNKTKLQEVLKRKLTDDETKMINYRRQANKTKIMKAYFQRSKSNIYAKEVIKSFKQY